MENFNFLYIFLAALAPFLIGFIWYHPKVLGTAWMNAAGLNEEKLKGGNMAITFGLAFVFNLMLAFMLYFIVVHQTGVFGVFAGVPDFADHNSETYKTFQSIIEKYGHVARTFKHGALHGGMAAILFALPVVAINALFERKGFKFIAINAGYWLVNLMIMGGIICAFA